MPQAQIEAARLSYVLQVDSSFKAELQRWGRGLKEVGVAARGMGVAGDFLGHLTGLGHPAEVRPCPCILLHYKLSSALLNSISV